MHIMSTNFAKTLVWKHGNDVKLWRHKQRTPNANDHHMTLNQNPPWKFLRTPLGRPPRIRLPIRAFGQCPVDAAGESKLGRSHWL